MAKTELVKDAGVKTESVKYTHSSAVSAWDPIYVDGLGVLIAHDDYDASAEGLYYIQGRFLFDITTGVTISQGNKVYYDVSANTVRKANDSNLTVGDFYCGRAPKAGTAAGGYAYVDINSDNMVIEQGIKTIAAAATLTQEDSFIAVNTSGGAVTLTLPACASFIDKEYTIYVEDATNQVTIDGNGSETINGSTTITLNEQYAFVRIKSNGTSWRILGASEASINVTISNDVVTKTANYTTGIGDDTVIANGSSITITLGTAACFAGKKQVIKNINATPCSLATEGSETIDGAASLTLHDQYSFVEVQSDGTNWHVINSSGYDEIYTVQGSMDNQTVKAAKLKKAGELIRATYFTAGALGSGLGIDVVDGGTDGSGTDVVDSCSDNLNGLDANDISSSNTFSAGDHINVTFDDFASAIYCSVTLVFRASVA